MYHRKHTQICPNQHTDLLGFLFKEDSLKMKNGLELVSEDIFKEFFDIFFIIARLIVNRHRTVNRVIL